MRKRTLSMFLVVALILALLSGTALAVDVTPADGAPTASGTSFFANGTPITIAANEPSNGTPVTFEGFTATGNSAYISWDDSGTTKYMGVGNNVTVWGGADGSTSAVSVARTSITMTGGTVYSILGGNFGQANATKEGCSAVTGDVNISVTGGTVTHLIYGGGENNTCVNETVTITLDNVQLGANCYVNGGVLGHGPEGVRNIEDGTMTTYAVVNKVVINATGSDAYVFGGGGSGSTKVVEAVVTLNNCTVDYLYASGINGEMEKSSLKATGCTITGELAATNRGFIETADVTLEDCDVELLMTGATTGCFETDSGKPDGSGITGSVLWTIDDQTEVESALLTPLAKRDQNDQTTATLDNITVEKSGDPLNISVAEFKPHSKASVNTFLVSETGTLTLKNVQATVANGQTLTNVGTIDMDEKSSLTVDSGATFGQLGIVNGTVDGDGTINNDYAARIGSTGYESLTEAIAAANNGNGGTIDLLKDIETPASPTAPTMFSIADDKNITINGNGKKITVTIPDSFGDRDQVFSVGSTKTSTAVLTLNGVDVNITGKNIGTSEAPKYKGDAFDVWGTLNITGGSKITVQNAQAAFTMQGGANAKVNVTGSTVSTTNLNGDFSNGGNWEITGSTVTINGCGTHGLSVEDAVIDSSTVSIQGAKQMGLFGSNITIQNSSNVTVTGCGADLPKESTWAPDGTSYKNPVELKNDQKLTVSGSTLSLSGNVDGTGASINKIYVGEGTVTNNGTINAELVYAEPATDTYRVTYMVNGQTYWTDVITATGTDSKTVTYTAPADPTVSGYTFNGWDYGDVEVTVTNGSASFTPGSAKEYTFTAKMTAIYVPGPVTPTEPDDEPEALPFTDVAETDWFYDAVYYVYDKGLMNGVTDTTFEPKADTSRAMLVTILWRLEGSPVVTAAADFSDVADGSWYANAVAWAAANEIVNGMGDGTFAPSAPITRQQMAAVLYRYATYKGYDVTKAADLSVYTDSADVQDYAVDAMAWANAESLITGVTDTTLVPAGSAIRAQSATILMRFAENVAK